MKEIKVLKDQKMFFWAKKDSNTYSRNIKDLLDYLEINYEYEEKQREKNK